MTVETKHGSELYQKRLDILKNEVSVYPVSCEKLAAGRTDREWLDAVLLGGAKIVQLRDKESNDRDLLAKARYFRQKTTEAGALFILNDRFDLALLADADGVHVGQGDLPPEEIRKLAPDWIIGLSCNSIEHIKTLQKSVSSGSQDVSYYNIGPIYPTKTKDGLHEFLGSSVIDEMSSECDLPFTVMGGIKYNHVDELLEAGVSRIAVVTAISKAQDIVAETKKWVNKITNFSHK
ncbi:MAG: thiamine phosphate synthase [Desulfotalea sp.]